MSDTTDDGADDAALLLDFFQSDGWYPEQQEDGILGMRYQGENGEWECYAELRRPPGQVMFYSVQPELVPESDLPRMTELITWINESLLVGNFELDLSLGQVRFKTSILLGPERLSQGLLRQMVELNVASMDRCRPALLTVLETNEEPFNIASKLLGVGG
jgi:hypothetical protein